MPLSVFCGSACAHGHARANHGKCHKMTSTDRYGFILQQQLGVDLTLTFGYKDTSKDSIWIRPVAKSIKKIRYFQAQQQGGSRSDDRISITWIVN